MIYYYYIQSRLYRILITEKPGFLIYLLLFSVFLLRWIFYADYIKLQVEFSVGAVIGQSFLSHAGTQLLIIILQSFLSDQVSHK